MTNLSATTNHGSVGDTSDVAFVDLVRIAKGDHGRFVAALAAAICFHEALVLGGSRLHAAPISPTISAPTEIVDIDIPKPPLPIIPTPATEPTAPTVAPPAVEKRSLPREIRAVEKPMPPVPAAAAQAGAVLTAPQDPNEPLDLTSGIVVGTAETYAGGATQASGTSTTAVVGKPSPLGSPTGSGAMSAEKPPPAGPDLSRPPALSGGTSWQCPFPAEAEEDGIDHAAVRLRVAVNSEGSVTGVTVLAEAGRGFGREARRCASSKKWTAGRDREGLPTSAVTTVNVRFDR